MSARAAILLVLFLLLPLPAWLCHAQPGSGLDADTAKWYNKTHHIREVTVSKKRGRYVRKGNPAVELMRRVIAAKRNNGIERLDQYQYRRYQKITLAANDVKPAELERGLWKALPGARNLVEYCPYNGRLILPLSVSESVSRRVYRRHPHAERDIALADRATGIGDLLRTGNVLTAALRDFFTDVNIYDNDIRLLQHTIASPIADGATAFYHYFIVDTVSVGRDRCVHLFFRPANTLDFGFSGELYVMDDGSYQVRRCQLALPRQTGVNFVDRLLVLQEFGQVADSVWALVHDDMVVELRLFDFLQRAVVVRNTRLQGHSFAPVPDSLFSRRHTAAEQERARMRPEAYWNVVRPVGLTLGEQRLGSFVDGVRRSGQWHLAREAIGLLVENYVETGRAGRPSRFDIGPVSSMVSTNPVDGLRTRIGGQTTAELHPQLFFSGYYARGWRSRNNYYKAEATYSFNRKRYLPEEFPVRTVSLMSTYDVHAPADRFLGTDKDNVFMAARWSRRRRQTYYNRQQLTLDREEMSGLRTTLCLTAERQRLVSVPEWGVTDAGGGGPWLRTTALSLTLRYAPGEKAIVTKTRRRPLNLDAPVLTLSHTMGIDRLLGGQVGYHQTEASLFRRFWLNSWGKADVRVRAGAQWSRVPFLLLMMAPANLSYVTRGGSFALVDDMELLMDRYAMASVTWDLNGKLFNRVPLLRSLKWREFVGVRSLWGTLTSKNAGQQLPLGCHPMEQGRPYVEWVAGIHNILRFLHIEYVRRVTYLDLPTATRQGVRFKVAVKF